MTNKVEQISAVVKNAEKQAKDINISDYCLSVPQKYYSIFEKRFSEIKEKNKQKEQEEVYAELFSTKKSKTENIANGFSVSFGVFLFSSAIFLLCGTKFWHKLPDYKFDQIGKIFTTAMYTLSAAAGVAFYFFGKNYNEKLNSFENIYNNLTNEQKRKLVPEIKTYQQKKEKDKDFDFVKCITDYINLGKFTEHANKLMNSNSSEITMKK